MFRRFLTAGICLGALTLTACDDAPPAPEPARRARIPEPDRGAVAWLDPEDSTTWAEGDKPFFLFLHRSRSYWSREMVRVSLSDPETAREIGRITRPVWIDADSRPDLVDRFALGAIPSLAILTPDLEWITGTTFIGHDDLVSLLRRIRILHDVPERMTDLERERERLLRRRPEPTGRFARTAEVGTLARALVDSLNAADAEDLSSEGRLLLAETGLRTSRGAWFDRHAGAARTNDEGLLVSALLSDDGVLRDPTTSLTGNAGTLYALSRWARVAADEDLARYARRLAHRLVDGLYDPEAGRFAAGTADFSFVDSVGTLRPVPAAPPLLDGRSFAAGNALAVSALSETLQLGHDERLAEVARRTLDTLRDARPGEGRATDGPGARVALLADAAHLIRACLDYADLTGEAPLYDQARVIAMRTIEALPPDNREAGPTADYAPVGADDDRGSASGVMAQGLVRLGRRYGMDDYAVRAEAICREAVAHNGERWQRLGAVARAMRMLSETAAPAEDNIPPAGDEAPPAGEGARR